jgi:SEL1 protein
LLDQAHAKPRWSPLNWLSRSTTNASNALGDAALALVHWTRSAKQQNIDALVKMGDYYLSGLGTAVSPENAASCYQAAAEPPGSAQAMWNLGWMHENGIGIEQDFHLAKRFYDQALETNDEAYLPVKLSLYKLRWRSWWNRVTGGSIHGIDEDMPAKKRRTFSEWLADFLEADAAMYYDGYEDDDLDGQEPMPGGDDYWDDGALDDDVMETLLIGGLIAALAWLVYYRGQRARAAEQRRRQAAENQQQSPPPPPQQQQDPVPEHEDGQVPQRQQQDWGMFPPPDDPAFNAWAAGGVGH